MPPSILSIVTQSVEGIGLKIELFLATAISFLQGIILLAGYICNNVFPQPLSEEDEAYYLRRAEEGDEEARNILIEHNLRLVAHIINRISTPFIV